MANINVTVNKPIADGYKLKFRTPCESTTVEGLEVKYPAKNGVGTLIKKFVFKDAHGTELSGVGNLFVSGVLIEVLLDVTHGVAYIKNADTNSYIESVKSEVQRLEENQKQFLGVAGKMVAECERAIADANNVAVQYNAMVENSGVASIMERNSGAPMSFWVGTQAEYDALTDKDESRLYIISDDDDLNGITNLFDNETDFNKKPILFNTGYACTDTERIAALHNHKMALVRVAGQRVLCSVATAVTDSSLPEDDIISISGCASSTYSSPTGTVMGTNGAPTTGAKPLDLVVVDLRITITKDSETGETAANIANYSRRQAFGSDTVEGVNVWLIDLLNATKY
jgi:hypothetical protein